MRAMLLCCVLAMAGRAAEVPVDLKTPADGAKITNAYDPRDLEVELRVTWRKAGSILDTVGINAAPVGSFCLRVAADGKVSASVYDPARKGGTNVGNGWHAMANDAKTEAGQATKVIVKLRDKQLALLVGSKVMRWDCPTSLSGQPIYVGDFKGDESWGAKYNIHQAMVGQVVLVYFGASRGSAPTSGHDSRPPTTTDNHPTAGGAAVAAPTSDPIVDEARTLSATDRAQLAASLAALRSRGIALGLVVTATSPTDGAPYRRRFIEQGQLPQLSGVLLDYADRYVFAFDTRLAALLSPEQIGAAWKAASGQPTGKRLLAVTQALLSGGRTPKPVDPVGPIDPVGPGNTPRPPDPVQPPTEGGTLATGASALETALRARNIAAATALMSADAGERCKLLFGQQPEAMAQLAALLSTRRLVAQGARLAEFEVTDGGRRYPLAFELIDGRWCLSRF